MSSPKNAPAETSTPKLCQDCGKPKFGPASTICSADILRVNSFYCTCGETFNFTAGPAETKVGPCKCTHTKEQHPASRGTHCIMAHCGCRGFEAAAPVSPEPAQDEYCRQKGCQSLVLQNRIEELETDYNRAIELLHLAQGEGVSAKGDRPFMIALWKTWFPVYVEANPDYWKDWKQVAWDFASAALDHVRGKEDK